MAKTFIDLASRWKSALGYSPAASIYTPEPMPMNQISLYGDARVYVGGQMTFEDLVLENESEGIQLHFGARKLTKSGSLGEIFAPPPMISWRKNKRLIIEPLDSDEGEVVERYGDSAWDIRLQGLIVDMEEHLFPLEKLETLRKMFEVPDSFKISGDIFNSLGITDLFFQDIEIAGIAGFQDTVTFNLNARSIKPTQFYLNDE